VKYDGYRLRLERNGDRVRLFTRNGYDWTKRILGSWKPR
jgi:bifunctional non-homologous end joining protein LigD